VKAELQRRTSLTDLIEAFFKAWPYAWLPMQDLAKVGGIGGWRTRVSEARERIEAEGGAVIWNKRSGRESANMYRPQAPIGRSGDERIAQRSLFS